MIERYPYKCRKCGKLTLEWLRLEHREETSVTVNLADGRSDVYRYSWDANVYRCTACGFAHTTAPEVMVGKLNIVPSVMDHDETKWKDNFWIDGD